MAKGWTISGISEQTREAVTAAAQEAGMPVGAWVEQALSKSIDEGLEPGVSIEEIGAVPVYSFETLLCAYAAIGIRPICSART